MTSPLQHLPMSEQPAVRSQIKGASKLPRYPHGHVMETTSSRPTLRRLDAVSVSPLNYSQVRFLLSLHPSIIGVSCPLNDMKFYGENSFGDRTAYFEFTHVPLLLH